MWRALAKLTHWDWLVVLAGLMVVALLQVWPMGRSGPEAPLARAPGPAAPALPPMSRDARTAFEAWQRDSAYFAVFALSDNGGAWGWTESYNTLAAAEANALAYCAANGAGCRVIERMLPAADRTDVLGSAVIDGQNSRFVTQAPYGAMAISDAGGFAWVAARPSQAAADEEALKLCNARRREGQPDYIPDWPCRIVGRLDAPGAD